MKTLKRSLFLASLSCAPLINATAASEVVNSPARRAYGRDGLGLKKRLVQAVRNQDIKMVQSLLRQGAKQNLDLREPKGETLLHIAAQSDSLVIVGELIKNGASVKAEDEAGYTPLHYALMSRSKTAEQIVIYLIKQGSDLTTRVGQDSVLPIHMAAKARFVEAADLMLSINPSLVDARSRGEGDPLRETPLFIAAKDAEKDTKEYNFPMLRLLVTAGGDIEYETGNGKSVQNPTGFQSQPRRDINAFILECAKVREESYERLRRAVVDDPNIDEVKIALNDGARLNGIYYRKNRKMFFLIVPMK